MILSLKGQPQVLRDKLATAFSLSSTANLCWQLGQLSDSPSTAFFIGYQAAMRCLDPSLPVGQWAAFSVSEKGIRNPYECLTQFDPATGLLEGKKSHVMMVPLGLDVVYVLARKIDSSPVELVLLKVDALSLQIESVNSQPFLSEVPHYAVSFAVVLPSTALLCVDAHQKINKPFRYWEDVHTTLSLTGWLQSKLDTASKELEQAAVSLEKEFKRNPFNYDLAALTVLERLISRAHLDSQYLSDDNKTVWQRDTLLLKFSQRIRDKIRQSLLENKQ